MVRLAQLVDGPVLRRLFERVTEIAIERGVAKGRKMRIDTTVVESRDPLPDRQPTHRGQHPARRPACPQDRSRRREKLARPLRNTIRSVGRRAREIAQIARQRGDAAKEAIKKPYRGLLRIAGRWIRTGENAFEAARAALGQLDAKAARKGRAQSPSTRDHAPASPTNRASDPRAGAPRYHDLRRQVDQHLSSRPPRSCAAESRTSRRSSACW